MLDKTRLAAAGRAFQDYRQMRGVRGFKQIDFAINRQVIRLVRRLDILRWLVQAWLVKSFKFG